jgi:hypothetical protein
MVALLDRDETGATAEAIAQLAKVCAVQGTAPSEALSFLGRLREALCVELDERPGVPFSTQEFALLWQRLDGLMLRMFDAYTASRDELAAIRAEEIRRMQGFAVKRVMT